MESTRGDAVDHATCRPEVLDRSTADGEDRYQALLASGRVLHVHDTIRLQARDLFRTRSPRKEELSDAECDERLPELLDGAPLDAFGRWVFYPWSGRLVHLLAPEPFWELRRNRNRYKLTEEEERRLQSATVGVVGLSVGNAVALTLALEGVGGHLKLADFDQLDLSNLNRLRAGVHELGERKTVVAARQIAELDPYLPVTLFHDGVHPDNADAFFDDLDVLVEECDSIAMKFALRELARARRVPVIMETSDRGMLDVERFDEDPERPLFHGLVGEVAASELRDIDNERKATLILRIIGARSTTTRAAASLLEIDRTLSSWPQLASDVTLGGATATVAVRHILLGQPLPSGRSYVDVEHIITQPSPPAPIAGADPPPPLPERGLARPWGAEVPSEVRAIVEAATLAPSGGNCQPWHFRWDGEQLWVRHDPVRSRVLFDARRHGSLIALGAALENLVIASSGEGLAPLVETFPEADDAVVAKVRFSPTSGPPDPLLPQLRVRVSNRQPGVRSPIAHEQVDALVQAAAARGAVLEVCQDDDRLAEIGAILGAGERMRFLNPGLYRDLMGEVRFTSEQAERTRDGIDLATLELTAFQRAAFSVLSRTDVAGSIPSIVPGRALEEGARDSIHACSAVALLSIDGDTQEDWLQAGRATQHTWLAATEARLAVQPMTALLFQFELLGQEPPIYTPSEIQDLRALQGRFATVFPASKGRTPVFLFRLAHAPEASARALRLLVDDVLSSGPGSMPTPADAP